MNDESNLEFIIHHSSFIIAEGGEPCSRRSSGSPRGLDHGRRRGPAALRPDDDLRRRRPAGRGAAHLFRRSATAAGPATPTPRRDARQHAAGTVLDHLPDGDLHGLLRLGGDRLLRRLPGARRRHGGLRRRQAVDVEVPAPRRAARDQRAARAGRPAGQAAADLRGRDPQLLRPGLPRPHGRAARPLHLGLVPGRPGRATITCSARSTAAPTTPAWSARSSSWSRPSTRPGCTCTPKGRWRWRAARSSSSTAASVATAPTRTPAPRCWRTCTASRSTCATAGRSIADDDYIRESILRPGRQDRRRLGEHHADLQGPGRARRRSIELIAYHQVAEPRRDAAAGRGVPAARRPRRPLTSEVRAMSIVIQEPRQLPPPPPEAAARTYLNVATACCPGC